MLCGRLFQENLLPNWLKEKATLIFWLSVLSLLVMVNIGIPPALLRYGITTALFALVICTVAYQSGSVAKLLSIKPMVALGEASYSLYILHRPIMTLVKDTTERFLGATPLWAMVAYLPLAIIVAFAVYKWLELPAQTALRKKFRNSLNKTAAGSLPSPS